MNLSIEDEQDEVGRRLAEPELPGALVYGRRSSDGNCSK